MTVIIIIIMFVCVCLKSIMLRAIRQVTAYIFEKLHYIRYTSIQTRGNPPAFFGHFQEGIQQRKSNNGYLCHRCAVIDMKYRY
jgi:hypothetical protein